MVKGLEGREVHRECGDVSSVQFLVKIVDVTVPFFFVCFFGLVFFLLVCFCLFVFLFVFSPFFITLFGCLLYCADLHFNVNSLLVTGLSWMERFTCLFACILMFLIGRLLDWGWWMDLFACLLACLLVCPSAQRIIALKAVVDLMYSRIKVPRLINKNWRIP